MLTTNQNKKFTKKGFRAPKLYITKVIFVGSNGTFIEKGFDI